MIGPYLGTDAVPPGLTLSVPGICLAHRSGGPTLFAIDIRGGIDLAKLHLPDLPLVGDLEDMAGPMKLGFQAAFTDRDIDEDDALRFLAEEHGFALRSAEIIPPFTLTGSLQLGDETHEIAAPAEARKAAFPNELKQEKEAGGRPSQAVARAADGAQWVTVHRVLGPVFLERVGIAFGTDDKGQQAVTCLLDASFTALGLTVSLDNLGVTSHLDHFDPEFSLSGLGIDYSSPEIEIGGALLRTAEGFAGTALVQGPQFALSALAGFASR